MKTELTNTNYTESTPLELSNFTQNQLATVPLNTSIELTRVTMVANLVSMSNLLLLEFENTTDLRSKLILSKDIQEIYSRINTITARLQKRQYQDKPIDLTPAQAPYLDYTKRKPRSLTWYDYVAWCTKQDVKPLNKGHFFTLLIDAGFKQKTSSGTVVLKPPGVR